MSRHRGAKLPRRYELLGGISLLSPAYLLSVERWPFHTEPPDHYDLLSHLLDLSVSQLSTLLPLHYQYDFRPDRKSTRLNSSHTVISYAVFCFKKKTSLTRTLWLVSCFGCYTRPTAR